MVEVCRVLLFFLQTTCVSGEVQMVIGHNFLLNIAIKGLSPVKCPRMEKTMLLVVEQTVRHGDEQCVPQGPMQVVC